MKAKDIREMSAEDISKELINLRREQFNLRMQMATGQGVRTHEFGRIRKDIARLKTVLHERENQKEGEAS
ncbi:MAG: 50S ribosomal protein L29 [Gammaproteobacteria bacterium]|nr:50S ribosomal protein L29 [Gammaproteobacteria bacterium]